MRRKTTYQQRDGHPVEHFTNRICRDIGHDWMKTTADNYRTCQRDNCHAA